MSTIIDASRERVWHALTTPSELIRWNAQIVALVAPAPGYPRIGQRSLWRYAIGSVEVTISQLVRRLEPGEKLQSELSMRLFRLDETYGLQADGNGANRTRLGLRMSASNSIPVVGGALDRFAIRELTSRLIHSRLHSIQKWCESE